MMKARWVLLLVVGLSLVLLWGCAPREQEQGAVSPEAATQEQEEPLPPLATPVPLEPWKNLRRKGLRPAQVNKVVAVWTGSVLKVMVSGELPTPCHRLRATMRPNTPPGLVELWLYVQEPPGDQVCTQQIAPFEVELAVQPPALPVRVLVNGQVAFINW